MKKKRKIIDIPFDEKLKFFGAALQEHLPDICILLPFQLVGLLTIYLAWTSQMDKAWGLYLIGGVFFAFSTFVMAATLPSSVSYYYEKKLAQKYGFNLSAIVTDKRVEDHSYMEKRGSEGIYVEEFHYIIGYGYEFENNYESEFYIEYEKFYNQIEVGSEIPIRVLKFKPEVSFPRRFKFGKQFGLKKSECN
ncbi:MAG: hypothetical protein GY710_23900 [Desulfobacteraceae bacterium]|nr:hypothetical protein [Desulfobacteraceae bacterium]